MASDSGESTARPPFADRDGQDAPHRASGSRAWQRIRDKGTIAWLRVVLIAVFGSWLAHVTPLFDGEGTIVGRARAGVFQFLHDLARREPVLDPIVIVLVDDDDYWGEQLAHRQPIDRRWLADFVATIARGHPDVIAIDFDLASAHPKGPAIDAAYRDETTYFLERLRSIAEERSIVLPLTLGRAIGANLYDRDSDVHSGFDWGVSQGRVGSGFIALPTDERLLPTKVQVEPDEGPREHVDSFALAIVRAVRPNLAETLAREERFPAASLVAESDWMKRTLASSDVRRLSDAELRAQLRDKIVIVSGGWSQLAYGRGARVDVHPTLVGPTSGAYIHANHVAAMLDHRFRWVAPERVVRALEVVTAVLGALLFVVCEGVVTRALVVGGMVLASFGLSWFFMHALHLYFDALVPTVLVFADAILAEAAERARWTVSLRRST